MVDMLEQELNGWKAEGGRQRCFFFRKPGCPTAGDTAWPVGAGYPMTETRQPEWGMEGS